MAEVDPGDVLRVSAVMKFKGVGDVVNTWTVKHTVGTATTLTAFAGHMASYMDTIYAYLTTHISDEIAPNYLSLANLTQDTVFGSFSWGSWAGGTATGEATAAQLCCLAYARTVLSRVQIRKYLGVFTEAGMTDGLWLSTVTTASQQALAYHVVQHVVGGGISVTGVAYNKPLDRATFALSATASTVPVIQRRRREGRGS